MNVDEPRTTFMMLPNDVVLNCLARVSRLHYSTLSLVSKSFRSLLASRELYQTRILFGRTESCLYVCLGFPRTSQHWFTLSQRPNSSKKVLVPITSPNSPCTFQSDFAKVGSNIYAIGGSNTYPFGRIFKEESPSSSVMVMDCGSHTWSKAPSMRVARLAPSTCVLDEKIYVMGGCKNLDATNWMEVFDTKTQTWEFESPIHVEKICGGFRYQSVGYDGNVYVQCLEKYVTYKLNKGRWREEHLSMNRNWHSGKSTSYCVIENVFYSYCRQSIRWYNSEERCWECLKGLEGLQKLFSLVRYTFDAKMTDYGGNLAVLWEDEKKIWCAEIALEKQQGSIWGTLEWFDVVLTTVEPYQYGVEHIVAVTL